MANAAEPVSVRAPVGLQRSALAHLGAAALVLAGAAALVGQGFGQAGRTAAVAVLMFAPFLLIAPARIVAHHPHPRFGAPNLVTTVRAAMTCLFGAALAAAGAAPASEVAWSLAALAGAALALDGLDGFLARRLGLSSAFGARYDMEVDAFLILLLSIAAWRFGKAGAWVLLSGLLRYLFVAAGQLIPALRAELPPAFWRKAVCVVQTAALIALATPLLQPPASALVAAAALLLLAGSFAADLVWLTRRSLGARAA